MGLTTFMRGFSIRTRMLGAIGLVLALLAGLAVAGFVGMQQMRSAGEAQLRAASGQQQLNELRLALGELAATDPRIAEAHQQISQLQQRFDPTSKASTEAFDAQVHSALLVFGGVVLLSVVLVVPLTLANMQSICTPLASACAFADAIAQGDLLQPVDTRGRDEITALQNSLGGMQAALAGLVGNIRQASDSIKTASVEIATGNQDLSGRTEQTASALQQTASSMEQLTGTAQQTADSARSANQLASAASQAAQRGGAVVSQVVTNMDDITTSSRKIGEIIGVIDGIAFQTNILALNAAVEAARAGEQGRGFAVVASEVRTLAQRSANAAREIKSLIGASVEKVESGARLVQDAGATMQEIVTGVQRVSDLMGEITAAATGQSGELGQVNAAVTQLDQMTQQNAALVEQSAAAAESMREQAQRLSQVVEVFQVGSSAKLTKAAPVTRKAYA
jgi:methyl-accepting chemotaxis protein